MPLPDRRGFPYITPYDGAAAGGGCARIRNRRPARPTAGLPAVGFLALVRAPLMAPEQGGGGRVGLYAGYARAGAGLVPLACHYGWSTGVTSGHQAYLLAQRTSRSARRRRSSGRCSKLATRIRFPSSAPHCSRSAQCLRPAARCVQIERGKSGLRQSGRHLIPGLGLRGHPECPADLLPAPSSRPRPRHRLSEHLVHRHRRPAHHPQVRQLIPVPCTDPAQPNSLATPTKTQPRSTHSLTVPDPTPLNPASTAPRLVTSTSHG